MDAIEVWQAGKHDLAGLPDLVHVSGNDSCVDDIRGECRNVQCTEYVQEQQRQE